MKVLLIGCEQDLKKIKSKFNVEYDYMVIPNGYDIGSIKKLWENIYFYLNSIECSMYLGIVIVLNIDLVVYTSNFLGLFCHHLLIPIILIDNMNLNERNSSQIKSAMTLINLQITNGVFFINSNKVHIASRLLERNPYTENYGDFSGSELGRIEKNTFLFNSSKLNPTIQMINFEKDNFLNFNYTIDLTYQIVPIYLFPGIDLDSYKLNSNIKAVVFCNIKSVKNLFLFFEQSKLKCFYKKCIYNGIDIFIYSKDVPDNYIDLINSYIPINFISNMSVVSAQIKLLVLYNQQQSIREQLIDKELYFEIINVDCSLEKSNRSRKLLKKQQKTKFNKETYQI